MPTEEETLKKAGVSEAPSFTDPYEKLAEQVQAEHLLCWDHQKPKKDEWEIRLKLYNNQKRDKKAVGDTTLFTIFQTVLASLYVDRLMAEWQGREEGDDEVADNLNALAEYDYVEMAKDEMDFDWIWDTLFFGRGLIDFSEYERDPDNGIYLPVPYGLDPITFLRDPRAVSINGKGALLPNRQGKGAARFFGWEVKMTGRDIEELPHKVETFKMEDLKFGSGTRSLLASTIEARDAAQGRQTQKMKGEEALGPNAEYDITIWHTHYDIEGGVKKVKVWLANERKKVIGIQILENTLWSVIDRPLYPTSHDWDGTSIPDLTEDKQRGRAVAQNLGFRAMKADIDPMYIYDSNKITNRKDLKFAFNKFIPVDAKDQSVANAIMPLIKSRPNMALLDFIYNSLEVSAQKATATPELKQGMLAEKQRTLGEINIVASEADTRYSLSAKVFGWSEKRFWRQWYWLYKDNFTDEIDEKVVRLVGAFGPKWRPLQRANIIARLDPDVEIESKVLSRAKQMEERFSMEKYLSLALQDPTSNRRYGLKKLGRLNALEKDEIDRLFPPTIDERIAEDQNDRLSNNEFVEVLAEDDHNVHLEIHSKAGDTAATHAHIETHKKALSIKKVSPELFPEEPGAAAFTPPGTEKLLPAGELRETKPIAPSQAPGTPAPPSPGVS